MPVTDKYMLNVSHVTFLHLDLYLHHGRCLPNSRGIHAQRICKTLRCFPLVLHPIYYQVLTDQSCPTPGCAIPMMRTPRGKLPVLTFCVQCSNEIQATSVPNSTQQTVPERPAPVSNSSSSHHSPSSTPPTEFTEITDSSAFEPLPETDEVRQRREQSDRASSEIGKKLLKGWAMLGEECPTEGCYGIPLVRPPKTGGVLDPRKVCERMVECVLCLKIVTGVRYMWKGIYD